MVDYMKYILKYQITFLIYFNINQLIILYTIEHCCWCFFFYISKEFSGSTKKKKFWIDITTFQIIWYKFFKRYIFFMWLNAKCCGLISNQIRKYIILYCRALWGIMTLNLVKCNFYYILCLLKMYIYIKYI